MNTFRVLIMVAILSARSMSLAAGADSSGGGGAFLCENDTVAESIDLAEASRPGRGFQIEYSSDPVEVQMERASSKLRELAPRFMGSGIIFKIPENGGYPLDKNSWELATPPDSQLPYIKKGCRPVGMMFWDADLNGVVVDKDIYAKLKTNTDKAAAWVHEYIHHRLSSDPKYAQMMDRIVGRLDMNGSTQARKITMCLFAKNCPKMGTLNEQLKHYAASDKAIECTTSASSKNVTIHKFYILDTFLSSIHQRRVSSTSGCYGGQTIVMAGEASGGLDPELHGSYGPYGFTVVPWWSKTSRCGRATYKPIADASYYWESALSELVPGFSDRPDEIESPSMHAYSERLSIEPNFLDWFNTDLKADYEAKGHASNSKEMDNNTWKYTLTCKRYVPH